jgi:hypothetical protein
MTGDRVVLRSSWGATACTLGAVLAGAWIGTFLAGGSYPIPFLVAAVIAALLFRFLYRTVVTARGVEVWWFQAKLIPWSQITGVVVGGRRWYQRYITVQRPPGQPWVRLAAPRASWGIDSGHLDRARDLIEEMWVRHRNDPPPDTTAPPGLWSPPPS